jgi:hypothetical protein
MRLQIQKYARSSILCVKAVMESSEVASLYAIVHSYSCSVKSVLLPLRSAGWRRRRRGREREQHQLSSPVWRHVPWLSATAQKDQESRWEHSHTFGSAYDRTPSINAPYRMYPWSVYQVDQPMR